MRIIHELKKNWITQTNWHICSNFNSNGHPGDINDMGRTLAEYDRDVELYHRVELCII